MKLKENFLAEVAALGFPLMEATKETDANATLAKVVKNGNLRLWEGFPVLLMKSAEKGLFDYAAATRNLKPEEKKVMDQLLLMSLVLYETLDLKFSWAQKLRRDLPFSPQDLRKEVKNFKNRGYFKSGGMSFSADRLTTVFQNYFSTNLSVLDNQLTPREEFGLEYALSQVFSPKQKELFWKKMRRENLTKTEKEYYSRSVKKKVRALSNEKLHQLAKSL